jgi:hypothetical protein
MCPRPGRLTSQRPNVTLPHSQNFYRIGGSRDNAKAAIRLTASPAIKGNIIRNVFAEFWVE